MAHGGLFVPARDSADGFVLAAVSSYRVSREPARFTGQLFIEGQARGRDQEYIVAAGVAAEPQQSDFSRGEPGGDVVNGQPDPGFGQRMMPPAVPPRIGAAAEILHTAPGSMDYPQASGRGCPPRRQILSGQVVLPDGGNPPRPGRLGLAAGEPHIGHPRTERLPRPGHRPRRRHGRALDLHAGQDRAMDQGIRPGTGGQRVLALGTPPGILSRPHPVVGLEKLPAWPEPRRSGISLSGLPSLPNRDRLAKRFR